MAPTSSLPVKGMSTATSSNSQCAGPAREEWRARHRRPCYRARDWRDCRSAWRRGTCEVNSRSETAARPCLSQGRPPAASRRWRLSLRKRPAASSSTPIPCRSIAISGSSRRGRRRDEEARVPHRLYGHVDAAVNFSAGTWVADAATVLAEARAQNRLPIFVGGSGLYFKALTRGLSAVPPIAAGDTRQRAGAAGTRRRRGAACRTGAARSGCRRTTEAARPHPHRARARSGRGDRAFADRLASRRVAAAVAAGTIQRGVSRAERDALYARIDARFDAMLAAGALEEVAALAARQLDPLLPAMKAHGVPALIRHLKGEITLERGGRDRPRRHPPLCQAAIHLVPAPTAGIRMGEAGRGEGRGFRSTAIRKRQRADRGMTAAFADVRVRMRTRSPLGHAQARI